MIYKSKKNINYSYVIGRFSEKTGAYFTYFPIKNWHNEFKYAKKFGFNGVEWLVSDLSNPIFNNLFRKLIKKNLIKNKIKISSIFLDFIMRKPLYDLEKKELDWIIKNIRELKSEFKFDRITVPLLENCRYENKSQKLKALNALNHLLINLKSKTNFCIETDLELKELNNIFRQKRFKDLGILVDLGNMRADNKNIKDYVNMFGERIFGIHLKFRGRNGGKSRHIPKKFNELTYINENFNKLTNVKDITFETFRSDVNYMSDMKTSIKNFNEIFK